jgi:hypothetical protein
MADNAVANSGTEGGADEKIVRVLEKTVESKVLKGLRGTLPTLVHDAVHEAILTAVRRSDTLPIGRAPVRPRSRKSTTSSTPSRPKAGGRCEAVWKELDKLRAKSGIPTLKDVLRMGQRKHWNPNNTRVEYYQWRKANGISGRLATAS